MSVVIIEMAEKALNEKESEIKAKVGPLVDERDELRTALKKLTRGSKSPNGAPSISDEDLIKAVGALTSGPGASPVKSTDIAKSLDVDPRTISRRLAKFAETEVIAGNKDDGYSV